ncbi:unnamed protein product, partial [Didymodactylos carnosus]
VKNVRTKIEHLLKIYYSVEEFKQYEREDRTVASTFLIQSPTPDEQRLGVLFEIELDVRLKSRPYAGITHLSYFNEESEILLGIRYVSELREVSHDESEKVWICILKLINDFDINDKKEYESTSERPTLKTCVSLLLEEFRTALDIEEETKILHMLIQYFPQKNGFQ